MTEQEFRELTAYQSPSPLSKARGPAVASVAAAVGAVKAPANNAAQEPTLSEQIAQAAAEPMQMSSEQAQGQIYPQAEFSFHQNTVQLTQSESPAPLDMSFEMVPQQKHEELAEQYADLSDRFQHLAEERDSLSREVSELKRAIAEQSHAGALQGRDYKEEIRLLGKLIDNEQSLHNSAAPGDELYARHDRLVNIFLNIVARTK
ncbi:MAG: hypothetical protein LBU13_03675 [Synergistaceae bacterium]|nr:hypothetical protein [Synergistaceae bacterium]